ncbi:hypothetical protein AC578_7392 [Pseudocercospora eumusae]|uniref:Uncharacterized protein n=1 Tax=Pseudocercospora eumusae TaxID=321146 RepID=A0A139H2Y7_9PEZI|nr:hypothetical protein AC578_7392 [Pseudocercospora eumusae]
MFHRWLTVTEEASPRRQIPSKILLIPSESKHGHKLEDPTRSAEVCVDNIREVRATRRDLSTARKNAKTSIAKMRPRLRVGQRPYSDELVAKRPKLAYGLVCHGGYDYLPGINGSQAENKQRPGSSDAIPTPGPFEQENVQ